MAKKAAPKSAPAPKVPAATPAASAVDAEAAPVATTSVRKTVAPKPMATMKKAPAPITHERIAERAYFISQTGHGGSEDHNWHRAEAELKNENAI